MAEQGRQRLAAHGCDDGGAPEHPGTGHPLRQHRQEEMGCELSFHGVLRLRGGSALLGRLGLPDVVRKKARPVRRPAERRLGPRIPPQASFRRELSERDDDLLPVLFRGDNAGSDRRSVAGKDELQGVDDVRTDVAYFLVHRRRVQPVVSRRVAGEARSDRLLRRLRHPFIFRCCRLHSCLLGK